MNEFVSWTFVDAVWVVEGSKVRAGCKDVRSLDVRIGYEMRKSLCKQEDR